MAKQGPAPFVSDHAGAGLARQWSAAGAIRPANPEPGRRASIADARRCTSPLGDHRGCGRQRPEPARARCIPGHRTRPSPSTPAWPPSPAPRHPGRRGMSRRQIDITPDLMLRAYRAGLFPMAESRRGDRLYWLDPERRGIIPLDGGFHLPKRLLRTVLHSPYRVTADADFAAAIAGCAAPAPGREDTWINPEIEYPLPLPAPPGPCPFGRGLGGRGAWSAACMAWSSAAPSSARACSAAPATPRSSPSSTSSRASGSAASPCSTASS